MIRIRFCAFVGCYEEAEPGRERCAEHEQVFEAAMEGWGPPITRAAYPAIARAILLKRLHQERERRRGATA